MSHKSKLSRHYLSRNDNRFMEGLPVTVHPLHVLLQPFTEVEHLPLTAAMRSLSILPLLIAVTAAATAGLAAVAGLAAIAAAAGRNGFASGRWPGSLVFDSDSIVEEG